MPAFSESIFGALVPEFFANIFQFWLELDKCLTFACKDIQNPSIVFQHSITGFSTSEDISFLQTQLSDRDYFDAACQAAFLEQ